MTWTSVLNGVATEAKQAELNALIGAAQDVPGAFTLLDRVKAVNTTLVNRDLASDAKLETLRALLQTLSTELATQQKNALTAGELTAADLGKEVTLAGRLSQAAFTARVGEVGEAPAANTVLARLKNIADKLTELDTAFEAEDFASELKLEAVRAVLAGIDVELKTQQKDALTNAELRLSDIEVNDDVAHDTLAAIRDHLGDPITVGTVRNLLARLLTELESQQKNSLTNGELRAQDLEVNDTVSQGKLDLLNGKDFATQLTLAAFKAQANADSVATRQLITDFESAFNLRDLATGAQQTELAQQIINPATPSLVQLTDSNATIGFIGSRREVLLEMGALKIAAVHRSFGGTLSSDQFVARFSNPLGSGVDVYVGTLIINSSAGQRFRFIEDATLTSPVTWANATRNLNRSFPNTTAVVVETAVVEPTSGDPWPGRLQMSGDIGMLELKNSDGLSLLKLPPGKALVLAGSSSATQQTGAWVTFAEVPIP